MDNKKWYLINENTTPNMIGGFENQAFLDFKNDAFMESLSTDIASTVILYKHDLSFDKNVRIIIQDNLANTQLKSLERTVLAPIGTLRSGDYLFFENTYWLVNGRPGNNKVYEKATIVLCQYKLRWQNLSGMIIERWVNLVSASKYDVGENGNYVLYLTSNNYTIQIPQDEETLELDGKRVFIDLNKKNPRKVFKITRDDDVLYNYGSHGGVLSLLADKTEINFKTDNTDLMICDYVSSNIENVENPNESQVLLKITHKGSNSIIAGGNAKQFTLLAFDEDGEEVSIDDVSWTLTTLAENQEYVSYEITDNNSIQIKAFYDESIIGTQIYLVASVLGQETSLYIDIGGGI